MDRYTNLESHPDCDLGADENGIRRFTRPRERAERTARSKKESDPAPVAAGDEVDVQTPEKEMRTTMTVRRPSDMRQRLSANWADDHHLSIEPECLADFEDVRRVLVDLEREGHHPAEFDCLAIAAELRQAAGDRYLDAAGDEVWTEALAWHRRAPFPVEAA